MVQLASTLVTAVAVLASVSLAHPGHNVKVKAAERAAFLKRSNVARGWGGCAAKLKARGLESAPFLKARGLSALNTSHESSLDVDLCTDPSVLFSSNATCVLASDVTQGPYYVSGELIRSDITEDQAGVPLYVDVQMVDSSTCEPVTNVYLDFWHCNATGVYSGVVASGNGNSNDDSNLDATFLRGLQKTDDEGVAQFQTIFPGHYTGRATHIHVLTHSLNETTINANNTIKALYTAHSAHVAHRRKTIRYLRPPAPHPRRLLPPRLRPDDGLAVGKVLPGVSFSRRLQRYRRRGYIPACDGVYTWLVQPAARRRVRDRLDGVESWWGGVPDYGESVDGEGRVWVDDADRRVCDPGVAGGCEFDGARAGDEDEDGWRARARAQSGGVGEAVSRGEDGAACAGAVDAGMSAALAEYLVAMLSAGSLFGRLAAGVLSDRVGAYNIFVCVVFLAGVLVLGLWIPASGNAAIIVFAVVFGFASRAYVSLPPALVVAISPLEEIGYRTGLLFLFSSVGGLTSSPIGGAILQRDGGSYTGMKVFAGVMLLVGTGFVMAARVVQTGWVLKAKF
ncbi:hypothetical protein CDV55_104592 [Aspergillus turcosus]|nr:hypothetical protein CDV55_104592 [Aspergillus turcosus]